jgi:microsomal dipeptidase-like Zn-dependent dipeptidase
MLCEIARNLDEAQIDEIRMLEHVLGMTVVAFSCRSLDPQREERLRQIMEEFGPVLQAEPAEPDDAQLGRIREAEEALGLSLVALKA